MCSWLRPPSTTRNRLLPLTLTQLPGRLELDIGRRFPVVRETVEYVDKARTGAALVQKPCNRSFTRLLSLFLAAEPSCPRLVQPERGGSIAPHHPTAGHHPTASQPLTDPLPAPASGSSSPAYRRQSRLQFHPRPGDPSNQKEEEAGLQGVVEAHSNPSTSGNRSFLPVYHVKNVPAAFPDTHGCVRYCGSRSAESAACLQR
ncbi:hypothetical protein MHYP_G00293890 [Metynnis hypsauchen]